MLKLHVSISQYQHQRFGFCDPSESLGGSVGRELGFRRTANHLLICDPRKIHSNVGSNFVLIPMPGIDFDEEPLSNTGVIFELGFRDSAISGCLEQMLYDWHD